MICEQTVYRTIRNESSILKLTKNKMMYQNKAYLYIMMKRK